MVEVNVLGNWSIEKRIIMNAQESKSQSLGVPGSAPTSCDKCKWATKVATACHRHGNGRFDSPVDGSLESFVGHAT